MPSIDYLIEKAAFQGLHLRHEPLLVTLLVLPEVQVTLSFFEIDVAPVYVTLDYSFIAFEQVQGDVRSEMKRNGKSENIKTQNLLGTTNPLLQ